MAKIAIIAALKREVAPLIQGKGWRKRQLPGVEDGYYENDVAVVACAGIGGVAAGRVAEVIIAECAPGLVVSAGMAGALTPAGKVGHVLFPAIVICATKKLPVHFALPSESARVRPAGTLVTSSEVGGTEAKQTLARQYSAEAIDMEAAAVAEIATAHGIAFLAVKAISDEYNFPLPNLKPFIDRQGQFQTGRFALHIAVRPAMWRTVSQLASNSRKASRALCAALMDLLEASVAPEVQ